MFPELDDLTYTPVPSSAQLTAIKSRGTSLRRRRRLTLVAVPAAIAATAVAIVLLPIGRAAPTPEPAGPTRELGPTLTVPVTTAPALVRHPLEDGADLAVALDLTPGAALNNRIFLVSGNQTRQLDGVDPGEFSLSPDGRFVAFRPIVYPSSTLMLLDVTTSERTSFLVDDRPVYSTETGNQLWWSADGRTLADGYWTMTRGGVAIDPRVRIWHVDDEGVISGPTADGPVRGGLLGMSPDGTELLALDSSGQVNSSPTSEIAFADTGIHNRSLSRFGGRVVSVDGGGFSPDGSKVGAFVGIGGNTTQTRRQSWILDLDSGTWTSAPLRYGHDFQRAPSGWSGDHLVRLDTEDTSEAAGLVRAVDGASTNDLVLTIEPARTPADSISLATSRVYFSPPATQ